MNHRLRQRVSSCTQGVACSRRTAAQPFRCSLHARHSKAVSILTRTRSCTNQRVTASIGQVRLVTPPTAQLYYSRQHMVWQQGRLIQRHEAWDFEQLEQNRQVQAEPQIIPRPRAATSVASMMGLLALLNSDRTQSRSCWLLSPCKARAGQPSVLSCLVSCKHRTHW